MRGYLDRTYSERRSNALSKPVPVLRIIAIGPLVQACIQAQEIYLLVRTPLAIAQPKQSINWTYLRRKSVGSPSPCSPTRIASLPSCRKGLFKSVGNTSFPFRIYLSFTLFVSVPRSQPLANQHFCTQVKQNKKRNSKQKGRTYFLLSGWPRHRFPPDSSTGSGLQVGMCGETCSKADAKKCRSLD